MFFALFQTVWGPNFKMCWDKVCHAADLIAFFHPNFPALGTDWTADEDKFSAIKQTYMSNFFRNGDPNVGQTTPVVWPEYTTSDPAKLHMDLNNYHVSYDANRVNCDFWDTVGYLIE